ncbi:Lrp/AsnC family transcriptional regulator [Embleya sp. NPDC050154]|uniref:Lrp/AsnC family transcriptional regulator n=1 Tax=unclassified Embleya TaxID=2699296 RepID=UPI0037969922|nr:Lrp/AsnC family transcriptional regulator [Embleya sp. NBC_00888]
MSQSIALDPIDLGILRSLQNDARISNKALAAEVGIAPSTCLDRVARLRSAGVVKGATVEVDAAALGRPLQAMLAVRVRPHHRVVLNPFVGHVLKLPETRALYHLAGPDDFLVHVAVADATGLQRLVVDGFTARTEVTQVHTMLIFQQWQGGPLLPPEPQGPARRLTAG